METNIQNLIEGALQPTTEASEPTPPKKTMSEAAIAANRANAQKSTGPRTAAGKLKSASNALQHGLYSLSNFEHFVHDNDITLEVVTNVMEQFQPITPAEHFLAHQLIHMQMRFLQMEFLYNRAMARDVKHILDKPVHFLNQILRELNSLPAHIQRTIKALHSEQVRREQLAKATTEILEIEPIPDQQPLPQRPVCIASPVQIEPKPATFPGGLLFKLFAERIISKYPVDAEPLNGTAAETNPSEN